jgi:hypothetical protein
MKPTILFFAVTAMVSMSAAQTPFKKYEIKSGIVTYETIMKMGTLELKSKSVVSFDDYGMKECRETYSNNKLTESYFSDGSDMYAVKHNQKKAYRQGPAYRGTELRVEWTEFGTEKDRQSGVIKKIPARRFAGKDCEMFESNDGKGTVTQYGGWNKILMYLHVKSKNVESIQSAIKLEENAKVTADKFAIPKGYSVQ